MRIALRWRDMDMLGHLNQSVYHELLEEGRAALFAPLFEQRRAGRSSSSAWSSTTAARCAATTATSTSSRGWRRRALERDGGQRGAAA